MGKNSTTSSVCRVRGIKGIYPPKSPKNIIFFSQNSSIKNFTYSVIIYHAAMQLWGVVSRWTPKTSDQLPSICYSYAMLPLKPLKNAANLCFHLSIKHWKYLVKFLYWWQLLNSLFRLYEYWRMIWVVKPQKKGLYWTSSFVHSQRFFY